MLQIMFHKNLIIFLLIILYNGYLHIIFVLYLYSNYLSGKKFKNLYFIY